MNEWIAVVLIFKCAENLHSHERSAQECDTCSYFTSVTWSSPNAGEHWYLFPEIKQKNYLSPNCSTLPQFRGEDPRVHPLCWKRKQSQWKAAWSLTMKTDVLCRSGTAQNTPSLLQDLSTFSPLTAQHQHCSKKEQASFPVHLPLIYPLGALHHCMKDALTKAASIFPSHRLHPVHKATGCESPPLFPSSVPEQLAKPFRVMRLT